MWRMCDCCSDRRRRTFWHWESRFTTPAGEEKRLTEMVGEEIYQAGFEAIREHLRGAT